MLLLGCSVPIEHKLEERAANEVVTELARAGIASSKGRNEENSELYNVVVAKGDNLRALEILRSLDLPRGRSPGFGEIYKQPSLIPTATEERARYVEALSGEIARTLESVEGVVRARVHLVIPEPDPLSVEGKASAPAQAAVLLKVRSGQPTPIGEADVQKLLSGSVSGLDQRAVAVVVTLAPDSPSGQGPGLVALGPLRLTPGSRTIVGVGFAALSAALVSLALLLLFLSRRLALAERGN
jgi:type III secretion protein J